MIVAVRAWILFSALLVGAGWILSAIHQLNRVGYVAVFVLVIIVLGWRWRNSPKPIWEIRRTWHKLGRRFRRLAPLLFLTLALMSLVAGMLYVPSNADSNAYRIPRVLHWLGAERWHWIRTLDIRMNIAGCGFEWLSTPLTLFGRTDRFVFLVNWASYLMLPGLIFSVFRRLRVRPHVAWWWMWLLASGWCYAMQAASDVNDSFAVIYALAAVDFALRAREKECVCDLWLSLLAAGLLTGAKQTLIPLAAVWLVAAWPGLRLLGSRPVGTAMVVAWSLLISAAPLVFFNLEHTGTWTGIPRDTGPQAMFWSRCQLNAPLWGILGNAFCLPLQNLEPPFFPGADAWNGMMRHFLQTPFGSHFATFENFGYLRRAMTDETAGIGLGILLLILISIGMTCLRRPSVHIDATVKPDWHTCWLHLTPFLALLIFMAKVGSFQSARQLGPYYAFFFHGCWSNRPVHIGCDSVGGSGLA